MGLEISPRIREKLAAKRPPVSEHEMVECFANRTGIYLLDTREQNQTDPPTRWFIAETDFGRMLKIVFIQKGEHIVIKTAYDPNITEIRIYEKHGR